MVKYIFFLSFVNCNDFKHYYLFNNRMAKSYHEIGNITMRTEMFEGILTCSVKL